MLHHTINIIEKTLEQLKRDKDDAVAENKKLKHCLKVNNIEVEKYKKFVQTSPKRSNEGMNEEDKEERFSQGSLNLVRSIATPAILRTDKGSRWRSNSQEQQTLLELTQQ
jgi:hypothetical protein